MDRWTAGLAIASLLLGVAIVFLRAQRWRDRKNDEQTSARLRGKAPDVIEIFHPRLIMQLPEPAQRYFRYTIQPGTPLYNVVEIYMTGALGLGTRKRPRYRSMSARQILAPPFGLVWQVKAGVISGSDGVTQDTSWTRFWLLGLIPIVRGGGNKDHHRSAFGRVIAEGAFWAPASLLPGENVRWEAVDETTARAIVAFGDFQQAIDISVAADGQPTRVIMQRWSNANEQKKFREQPFGGDLSRFKEFCGYRLPTRIDGGNHIGTEDYFPFFRANVRWVRFHNRRSSS